MAVWLVRAGSHGEHEPKFIQENRIYLTWDSLDVDLSNLRDRSTLLSIMSELYVDAKAKTLVNWASQVWPFAHEMKNGDLVVLPLKTQAAVQIGEIVGDYHFESSGTNPFFHWRAVKWSSEPIPRSNFAKDLLFTFGAFLTICRVQRNNAEARLVAMRENGWRPESLRAITKPASRPLADEATDDSDLETLGRDQIASPDISRWLMDDREDRAGRWLKRW